MPPCIDIYALCAERSAASVLSFLEKYGAANRWERAQWDLELGESPEAVIRLAAADPTAQATLHLSSDDPRVHGLIVHFASEGFVILGLEVDDPLNEPTKASLARSLVEELRSTCDCESVAAIHEWVPPNDRATWASDVTSLAL